MLPVMREHRRYVAFKVQAKPVFTPNQIIQAIRSEVLYVLGESSYADANFDIVRYDEDSMMGIARVTDAYKDTVISAMSLIDNIQGKKAGIWVLGVSGTIKRANSKFLH